MYAKALIPMDGSPSTERAVEEALRMAPAIQSAELVLVEPSPLKAFRFDGGVMYVDEFVRVWREAGEEYLRPFKEKLEAAGITEVNAEVRFGEPLSLISKLARERGADLILLGGEEGGWLFRGTGFSSLAGRLVRKLDAAVMVVREAVRAAA